MWRKRRVISETEKNTVSGSGFAHVVNLKNVMYIVFIPIHDIKIGWIRHVCVDNRVNETKNTTMFLPRDASIVLQIGPEVSLERHSIFAKFSSNRLYGIQNPAYFIVWVERERES